MHEEICLEKSTEKNNKEEAADSRAAVKSSPDRIGLILYDL